MMRDSVSTPTTSTLRALPDAMSACAIVTPYMNPEHAAVMSKAAALLAPMRFWTRQAVDGKGMSEVAVAMRMMSRSSGVMPASASARFVASMARSLVACSGFAIRRSLIPVRETIHSSEVSSIRSKSAFVSTTSGR